MYFDVTEARHIGNYEITLNFEDGSVGRADLSKFIEEGTVFGKLKNMEFFKRFQIEYDTIAGTIDKTQTA